MRIINVSVLSLALLAGAAAAMSERAAALSLPPSPPRAVLLNDASAVFLGTVIGTSEVRKGEYYYYARLDIRVDETIGSASPGLHVNEVVAREVTVLNAVFDDYSSGVRFTPELAEVGNGDIRFEFQSGAPSHSELHTAMVGKQFYFVLHTQPDLTSRRPLATIWPLWQGEWIRSCWTGGSCADRPTWRGPMGLETSACAARVLALQPKLSDVHAGYAPYVKFTFVGTNSVAEHALAEIRWSESGQHLMGAPMLLLKEAPVLRTAPLRNQNGAVITDENQDDNPLKSAIPVLAKECSIIYAGNGAHPR